MPEPVQEPLPMPEPEPLGVFESDYFINGKQWTSISFLNQNYINSSAVSSLNEPVLSTVATEHSVIFIIYKESSNGIC